MKFALTAAAATLLAGTAFADIAVSDSATGYIVAVDLPQHRLVLSTGAEFDLLPSVDVAGLTVGKQALVAFNRVNGRPVAASVFTGYYSIMAPLAGADLFHNTPDPTDE